MTNDALADAIAREEHHQGLPVGTFRHCEACDNEIIRRRMRLLVERNADTRTGSISPPSVNCPAPTASAPSAASPNRDRERSRMNEDWEPWQPFVIVLYLLVFTLSLWWWFAIRP